jgi:hypothetical protein
MSNLFILASLFLVSNSLESKNTFYVSVSFDDEICGIMDESSKLQANGEFTKQNQFPWMALITVENGENKWTHSAGSLISNRHVLAHPMTVSRLDESNNYIPVGIDKIKIFLGANNRDKLNEESGAIRVNVSKILNHPQAKYDSNLSVFVNAVSVIALDREVRFTPFIRPVCLWSFKDDFDEIIGEQAILVGYTIDNQKETFARMHSLVIIQENCNRSYSKQLGHNETRFFCARGYEAEGPCGDGIQLFMKVGSNWFIKGLLSWSHKYANSSCDVGLPTLYEDIEQHVEVIQKFMDDSEPFSVRNLVIVIVSLNVLLFFFLCWKNRT